MRIVCLIGLSVFVSFVILGCTRPLDYYLSKGEIFHTSYHIKYEASDDLSEEINATLKAFDASLNPFDTVSIISRINRNEIVEVDTFFASVFCRAKEIAIKTSGAFDITCAPLINAWGFGFHQMDSVSPALIDSLKTFVGYENICLDGRRIVKKDPRVQINCSAVAKGYACDVIAKLLDRYGIQNYMIEIGGEICAKGKNPKGDCWQIEILKPIDDNAGLIVEQQEVVGLCNKSMATSGNYRNYYIKDGKKYAHTIDPSTGYPSESDLLSATVIAPDCMTADAYATAFLVLGMEKSCKLIEELNQSGKERLAYYFIYINEDGKYEIKQGGDL